MRIINKALFSLVSSVTLLAPLSLTSCSQAWGYLNPISCGSSIAGETNDPFNLFRKTNTYKDADGQSIPGYLQSNFIIDQSKTTSYAYSSPVTKWYDSKEDEPDEKEREVWNWKDWQHLDDGWKTQTYNFSTSVTLYDQTLAKEERIKRVYNNNENTNQLININLTPTIASSIQSFITGALRYQGSQIADRTNEDLETAWGLKSQDFIDKASFKTEGKEREFYESVFACANMHASGKTSAFMRPTSINFNYDKDFFPFPTYMPNPEDETKKQVSNFTKLLLLGAEDVRFSDQWRDTSTPTNAYFTDLRSNQSVTIPYIKDGKWKYESGHCNQYLFSSVPVLVHVNDLGLEWVNPQKNNSFIPSDYFVEDKNTVIKAVGNSWSHLKDYVEGADGEPTFLSYKFKANNDLDNSVKFQIKKTSDGKWDERLKSEINLGNTFVVLIDYIVNEYDDPTYVDEYAQEFSERGEDLPSELTKESLGAANAVSINGISNIFPAYILGLGNETWFKRANNKTDDARAAYIIDNNKINKYKTNLSKLITFSNEDGRKPHAKDISQPSKNLLAFLTYMFGKVESDVVTIDMSFIQPTRFSES